MICSNWCIVASLQPRIQAWVSVYEFISANIISGLRFAHEKARVWPNSITLLFGDGINYSYYFFFLCNPLSSFSGVCLGLPEEAKGHLPSNFQAYVGRTRKSFFPQSGWFTTKQYTPTTSLCWFVLHFILKPDCHFGATSLRFRLAIRKSFCFPLQANLLKKVQLVTCMKNC